MLPVERAGETALPSALIPHPVTPALSRRSVLAGGSALAALALAGCGSGSGGASGGGVTVYALSGRGRRISNAAKLHDANKRFRFSWVARFTHAHPDDHSRVVSLVVSQAQFDRMFGGGALVADLRHLPPLHA